MSITEADKLKIKSAFEAGTLKTKSVNPVTGEVSLQVVSDVMQHHTPYKQMLHLELSNLASVDITEDHSVFISNLEGGIKPVDGKTLRHGEGVAIVTEDKLDFSKAMTIRNTKACEYTYDLCVPGFENFVLANGIVAHNSYSIGGVSLDIERSAKYQSLMDNASNQFEKAIDAKARTVKYIRGLQQPKHGIGVRSAFGNATARGVLSIRNFM